MATLLVQNELCVRGLPLLRSHRHLCNFRTAMLAIAPRLSGSANVGIARPTLRRWESRRGQLRVVRAAGDDEPATEVDVSVFRFTLGKLLRFEKTFSCLWFNWTWRGLAVVPVKQTSVK